MNKFGSGALGVLHIKYQASEQSGFEAEDFEYFSMYCYSTNIGPPGRGPCWTRGPSFEQTC